MQSAHKVTAFLLVSLLGVYGCAQGPVTQGPADTDKVAVAKAEQLEKDFRAAAVLRDQFRQKAAAAEEREAGLRKELEQSRATAARERDGLNVQLKSRTLERDNLQVQYDGFRKNIKELIGQAETALLPAAPATVASKAGEAPSRN